MKTSLKVFILNFYFLTKPEATTLETYIIFKEKKADAILGFKKKILHFLKKFSFLWLKIWFQIII